MGHQLDCVSHSAEVATNVLVQGMELGVANNCTVDSTSRHS